MHDKHLGRYVVYNKKKKTTIFLFIYPRLACRPWAPPTLGRSEIVPGNTTGWCCQRVWRTSRVFWTWRRRNWTAKKKQRTTGRALPLYMGLVHANTHVPVAFYTTIFVWRTNASWRATRRRRIKLDARVLRRAPKHVYCAPFHGRCVGGTRRCLVSMRGEGWGGISTTDGDNDTRVYGEGGRRQIKLCIIAEVALPQVFSVWRNITTCDNWKIYAKFLLHIPVVFRICARSSVGFFDRLPADPTTYVGRVSQKNVTNRESFTFPRSSRFARSGRGIVTRIFPFVRDGATWRSTSPWIFFIP